MILHRLQRNVLPTLNTDMSIEYGLKIPPSGVLINNNDIDIEWVVSASSSASASNLSSARSNRSLLIENNTNFALSIRRTSGTKRLPWEDEDSKFQKSQQFIPKIKTREIVPLKAFPLNDESDFIKG